MRFSSTAAGALALAGSAFAAPVAKSGLVARQNLDLTVLQFALTLEHLENVFYYEALQKFSCEDFVAAGYSRDYYYDLQYVSFDEQTHVNTLSAAITSLGATPVEACTYSFPYTDVVSFIALSQSLENAGVSAYTGAGSLITDPYYLTVATTIVDVEALHTSYQRIALGEVPMANPFETPLDPTSVYTLATMFIVECPASNPALPFTAFPYLAYDGQPCTCEVPECGDPSQYIKRGGHHGHAMPPAFSECVPPMAGDYVSFTAVDAVPAGSFLTYVNGLAVASVAADIEGMVASSAIPSEVMGGQAYAFITSSDISGDFSGFDDSAVLFGPAILEVKPGAPLIPYNP